MTVYVCPLKDRDCGDWPAGWCGSCQKRRANEDPRDALLRQALEALEYEDKYHATWGTKPFGSTSDAIAAIRKHLGERG